MIPFIERTYDISYARISVLFVSTFIGYVVAAAVAGALTRKFGFGKTLCLSVVIELLGVCGFLCSLTCILISPR